MLVYTVLGVGSPSVGLLERLDCTYKRPGDRGSPALDLRLQVYTSPSAASAHLAVNVVAERDAAHATQDVAIGTARAVLLTEPSRTVLMLADGRSNLTISLAHGVLPDVQLPAALVDLAQRVMPTLPASRSTP